MESKDYWFDQSQQWLKSWVETEKTLWQNYLTLMGMGTDSPPAATSSPNDRDRFDSPSSSEPPGANQAWQTFNDFFRLTLQAWQEMAPFVQANVEQWQNFLDPYKVKIRSLGLPTPPRATSGDLNEFWQLYLRQLQTYSGLPPEIWQSFTTATQSLPFNNPTVWLEWSDLYFQFYEKNFGNFISSPSLGYSREFNQKLLKGFGAWIDLSKASFDYQVVLGDIRVRAFEEIIKELTESQRKGEPIQDWKKFIRVWSVVFDRVFTESFLTSEGLNIRGRFLKATLTYQLQERQLVEVFLKAKNQPSRSELDEMHRHIYQLNKEVKALKKAIATLSSNRSRIENVSRRMENEDLRRSD